MSRNRKAIISKKYIEDKLGMKFDEAIENRCPSETGLKESDRKCSFKRNSCSKCWKESRILGLLL